MPRNHCRQINATAPNDRAVDNAPPRGRKRAREPMHVPYHTAHIAHANRTHAQQEPPEPMPYTPPDTPRRRPRRRNDLERELWVRNDPALYALWQREGGPCRVWIAHNRSLTDEIIDRELDHGPG